MPGRVASIEYDPKRTARIALIFYRDGEKRYILAPVGLQVDDIVQAGPDAEIRVGNALPLRSMPSGTVVHNVELLVGRGGQIVPQRRRIGPAHGERREATACCVCPRARCGACRRTAWPRLAR